MSPMPIPVIPPRYTLAEKLVSIEHVSLTLDGKVILRDVNAEIRDIERADCAQGQVVSFLGPSGIGKTRLSRIIAGLDQPTTGRVLINTDVAAMTPVKRGQVGMVAQSSTLFDFQTVQQNLTTAAAYAANPRAAAAKVQPFIEQFGLREHLTKFPVQLSGGTRQRVAVVRQLLCSDHLLIADEPFSGLDPIMKEKACTVFTQVASLDSLNTSVIVTHDVSEGLAISDHCWLMGLEQQDGQWLPGARIVEVLDLASMGLCWRPDIHTDPQFQALVGYVKNKFKTLRP